MTAPDLTPEQRVDALLALDVDHAKRGAVKDNGRSYAACVCGWEDPQRPASGWHEHRREVVARMVADARAEGETRLASTYTTTLDTGWTGNQTAGMGGVHGAIFMPKPPTTLNEAYDLGRAEGDRQGAARVTTAFETESERCRRLTAHKNFDIRYGVDIALAGIRAALAQAATPTEGGPA